jgi:hypothetical protein
MTANGKVLLFELKRFAEESILDSNRYALSIDAIRALVTYVEGLESERVKNPALLLLISHLKTSKAADVDYRAFAEGYDWCEELVRVMDSAGQIIKPDAVRGQ